jgi:cytochrome c biogenesis protein CcmG, thiol:disulfide interchange protein DsbE
MDEPIDSGDAEAIGQSDEGKRRFSSVAILLFFFLAMLGLLAIQFYWPRDESANQLGVGAKLPNLQLEPLTGDDQPVRLRDLAGKVVLLDFWGTWCPPCRAEIPHIAELRKQFRDEPDFRLLAVSCRDQTDDPESLRPDTEAFLDGHKLDLPTYADPGFYTRLQLDKIDAFDSSYPTTLLLDRESVIRAIWVGYSPETVEQMGKKIAKLLAEKPAEKK